MFCIAMRKRQRVARMSGPAAACFALREETAEPNQPGRVSVRRGKPSGLATPETNPMPLRSNLLEKKRPQRFACPGPLPNRRLRSGKDGGSFVERLLVST
jgi:hypothetical protein